MLLEEKSMKINKVIYPLDNVIEVQNANDKELFNLYVDNIIDMQSLSAKDDNYEINKMAVSKNIKLIKKEIVKRDIKKIEW